MIKSIQIGYDDMFEKKCRFASEGGFGHIAVNFTKVLDKTEYEWDKVIEDIKAEIDNYISDFIATDIVLQIIDKHIGSEDEEWKY